MKQEKMGVHGAFTGTLIKADGTVHTYCKDNLILDSGIDALCDCLMSDDRTSVFKYIALGTGTAEAEASQTALISEFVRKEAEYTHTAGAMYFTLSVTFNPGEATGAITEAGISNADNVFFDRVAFPVINKGESDTYEVTFKITLARA